ncbi:MAG: sigma factor-like helix-turn-helix DNA-binding protein [Patescibacteria group bacterium]
MAEPNTTENTGSILDRVLSSQHAQAIEGFVPTETFSTLIKTLSGKEQDVLRRRFGLHGNDPETLEEIGTVYHVTRERIRQIENGSIAKIVRAKAFKENVVPVERLILSILNTHGGIMEESLFFSEALSHAGNTAEQQRALRFILEQLLNHKLVYRVGDSLIKGCWKLAAQSLDIVEKAIQLLVSIVSTKGSPVTRDELYDSFKKQPLYQEHATWFIDDTITSYIGLSTELAKNPFGEYGLSSWGTIVPRRMNDKILLVLRKHGKPMHFTEIANQINETGFDRRKAYPPTVHNELILNKQYVLIGRGIYALSEWGYKPGVVADVIVETIRKEQRPMTRDELIKAVLAQRMVKRNTVLLALTNKSLFNRRADGTYELVSQ